MIVIPEAVKQQMEYDRLQAARQQAVASDGVVVSKSIIGFAHQLADMTVKNEAPECRLRTASALLGILAAAPQAEAVPSDRATLLRAAASRIDSLSEALTNLSEDDDDAHDPDDDHALIARLRTAARLAAAPQADPGEDWSAAPVDAMYFHRGNADTSPFYLKRDGANWKYRLRGWTPGRWLAMEDSEVDLSQFVQRPTAHLAGATAEQAVEPVATVEVMPDLSQVWIALKTQWLPVGMHNLYTSPPAPDVSGLVSVPKRALCDFIEYSIHGPHGSDDKWLADKKSLVAAAHKQEGK